MQAEAANALGAGPTLLPPCFISHPDVVEEKMPEEMAALMMFLDLGKQDWTNKHMRRGALRFHRQETLFARCKTNTVYGDTDTMMNGMTAQCYLPE